MSALDVFVTLTNTTDGRDKIYKTFAGLTKALGAIPSTPNANALTRVSKAIGDGRSLMRMGKWTSNIQKLEAFSDKMHKLTGKQMIEIVRILGDFGYVLGDNITWLAKYSVVPANPNITIKYAKICQFWGFLCACILDLLKISETNPNERPVYVAAILNFIKDFADTLACLAAVGYAQRFGYNPSSVFIGTCSVVSGGIATYTNWGKASKEVAKAADKKKAEKKE